MKKILITREEFVKMAMLALNLNEIKENISFEMYNNSFSYIENIPKDNKEMIEEKMIDVYKRYGKQ